MTSYPYEKNEKSPRFGEVNSFNSFNSSARKLPTERQLRHWIKLLGSATTPEGVRRFQRYTRCLSNRFST